jgi:hypothetical protein
MSIVALDEVYQRVNPWRTPDCRVIMDQEIDAMPDPASTIGYSFSPDQSNRTRQGFNSGVLPNNASEALRILSLHLPAMLAGSPIAPDALLRSGVAGAAPFSTLAPASAPVSSPGQPNMQPFAAPSTSSTGPAGRSNYSGTVPIFQPATGPNSGTPTSESPSSPSQSTSPAPAQTPQGPIAPTIDINSLLSTLFGGSYGPGALSGAGNPF